MVIKKSRLHRNLHQDMSQRDKLPVSRISHDHHHGLVMSQRILDAVDNESADFSALAAQIIQFFDDYMVPHFAMEENILFPAIERERGKLAVVKKLIAEHHDMRMRVTRLRIASLEFKAADFRQFSQILERHIRKEEKILSGNTQRTDRSRRTR